MFTFYQAYCFVLEIVTVGKKKNRNNKCVLKQGLKNGAELWFWVNGHAGPLNRQGLSYDSQCPQKLFSHTQVIGKGAKAVEWKIHFLSITNSVKSRIRNISIQSKKVWKV